jgi:mRNA-degrading endonuclease RelE of RelBE toxin-antitoxin system
LFSLFVHDDAKTDLRNLREREPQAARRLLALLQQLQGDPDLLDRLTQHDYGAKRSADFHVSKWHAQWRRGRDLWRLKVWDLENKGLRYRVVYAFDPRTRRYYVLAIAPREFDYDENHPLSRRILNAYNAL